jgi:hypothetical protein
MRGLFLGALGPAVLAGVASGCNAILDNGLHTLDVCPPGATMCADAGAAVLGCDDGNGWTEKQKCSFACAGGACIPMGWSPVALTSGACPAGFASPSVYVAVVSASPYTCTCNCSGTQVCSGSGVLRQYGNGGCTGSPVQSLPVDFSTGCTQAMSATITGGADYMLSNVSFGPAGTCSATAVATDKPSPTLKNITVCQPDLSCAGGACMSLTEQAGMCVSATGDVACPAGLPTKTVVALSVVDNRACGGCSCGSTLGCTFTSLIVDGDYACGTGNPYNFIAALNGCVTAPNTYYFNASMANANVNGSGVCQPTSASKPSGNVALDPTTTLTLCCP